MSLWPWLSRLAASTLVLGCASADERQVHYGAQSPGIEEPKIGIGVRQEQGSVRFDFWLCGQTKSPLAIRSLVVMDKFDVVCEVARSPSGLISTWRYGSSTDGFEVKTCRALFPGKHSICASGGGWGCQDFEISAAGEIRVTRGWCASSKPSSPND